MFIYLLKSGACLAIFMVFYKFFLEKENMHIFKRYYLLGALLIAFGIPFITFTHYIEATPVSNVSIPMNFIVQENVIQIPETNYLPIILWSIYGIGVLIFGAKFLINLLQIIFKISRNPKRKSNAIIHVLLSDLITPHTFFNYIFLNKQKFEKHEIPQEVFWHEETHAKQKHSFDVLFVELLQVVFWFNPLIYFSKQAIKMNHEFLADQAVLNKGISPYNYQHILLAFSSTAAEPQLTNAINYSSIKKRFTVMKTNTTKQKIWFRSMMLLPLLALTLYGFSEKTIVEKENILTISNSDSLDLYLTENGDLLLEETIITFEEIRELYNQNNKLHVSIQAAPNIDFVIVKNTIRNIKELGVKKTSYCTSGDTKQPTLEETMKEMLESTLKNKATTDKTEKLMTNYNLETGARPVDGQFNIGNSQDKATEKEIAEYNKLAKYYNDQADNYRTVKLADIKRLWEIYEKMDEEQKAKAQPFPNLPPPPPPALEGHENLPPPPPPTNASSEEKKAYQKSAEAYYNEREKTYTYNHKNTKGESVTVTVVPEKYDMTLPPPPPPPIQDKGTNTEIKTGFLIINGQNLYYVQNKNLRTYYNREGNIVDNKGKKLNGNIQANASDIIPNQYITKIYKDSKVVVEFKDNMPGNFPPPPPPISPLHHVMDMNKKGAFFFYNGKAITGDEAVEYIEKNKELKIFTKKTDTKQPTVYITTDPINSEN